MADPVAHLRLLKKHYPHAKYYLHFSNPFQLLIAAILSAQCRDEVVNATTAVLFKKYTKPEDYMEVDLHTLIKDISKITFAGNKAKFIKGASKILVEKYHGKVPRTMEDLTSLPGVGKKTASAILINAFGIVIIPIVDAHVIRISQRLGWTRNKDPEKIANDIMGKIPKHYWGEIQNLLKTHGRAVCKAPIPDCSTCFLEKLCPKVGVTKHH